MTSPTVVSRRSRGWPFMISATSVDVPPTSTVSRFGNPACTATHNAPVTPPAGPDINRLTGKSSALFADASPPSERRMCSLTRFALASSFDCRFLTYFCTRGRTYELATVVTVRSYSCISGTTSDDSETGMPGRMSCAISLMRRSCLSLAKALISETVSASMFFWPRARSSSRSFASSRLVTTSPLAPTRSSASIVSASGAIGSDLL